MRTLNEMLEEINSTIASGLEYSKAQMFAEAHLQTKDELTFPVVNQGNQSGYKISLNDNYALQSYHRVLETETETDPNRGYGKKSYRTRVYTIRNVWLGNTKRMPSKVYETNDEIKNDVFSWFPNILSSKELIITTSENTNKLDIINEEFEGIIANHLSLDVIAFYINYQIKQKIDC